MKITKIKQKAMEKEEVENFVDYLVYEMSEYHFQTVIGEDEKYTPPRPVNFSKFAYNSLLKFLKESSVAYYEELLNNERYEHLNAASLLEAYQSVIEASKWKEGGHSEFFELCGKLTILRGFADGEAASNSVFYGTLTKLALEAEKRGILDPHYDQIRKFAMEIVYSVFKWQGLTLSDFITDRNYAKVQLPKSIANYFEEPGRKLLSTLESNKSFAQMNIVKFKYLLHYIRRTYWTVMKSVNPFDQVSKYNSYIALLAVHCAKVDYREGIELAFDSICYILSTYFKRDASQRERLCQLMKKCV